MIRADSNRKLSAFTIMEVTVVLAIMSILVTIIATSMNRFGEQLKNSSDISQELNEWNAFRSNLWKEFYYSDSLKTQDNNLFIYKNLELIEYNLTGNVIQRTTNGNTIDTKIEASGIRIEEREKASLIIIDVLWKGDIMSMEFYNQPVLNNQINSYFEKL